MICDIARFSTKWPPSNVTFDPQILILSKMDLAYMKHHT